MSAGLPAPKPSINPETKPFWDATLEGKLLLKVCNACDSFHWYPRVICPRCGSFSTTWTEGSGKGSIYTYTVVHRPEGEYADAGPYVLAYVELDEGPRMMTNIVDVEPEEVAIGQRVEVVFHDTGADAALPRFRPATSG
jgi:uncharacterized OB-fold protein